VTPAGPGRRGRRERAALGLIHEESPGADRASHQQGVVAELGQRALTGAGLTELFDAAVTAVAGALGVEYVKVLELRPEGTTFLLRAGIGWTAGAIGHATVEAGRGSQAGYTLLAGEPVVVPDLRDERRFSAPPLLEAHGVVSGISTVIRGRERPFGVLGAHTRRRRDFTPDEVTFIRSVANVLAMAIARKRAMAALASSEERYRSLVGPRSGAGGSSSSTTSPTWRPSWRRSSPGRAMRSRRSRTGSPPCSGSASACTPPCSAISGCRGWTARGSTGKSSGASPRSSGGSCSSPATR
jgi:hypothetical protein